MADISSINRVLRKGSKIPIYTGKLAEFRPWMTALLKKERIYKLTDPELVALACDFTDGIASDREILRRPPGRLQCRTISTAKRIFRRNCRLIGDYPGSN